MVRLIHCLLCPPFSPNSRALGPAALASLPPCPNTSASKPVALRLMPLPAVHPIAIPPPYCNLRLPKPDLHNAPQPPPLAPPHHPALTRPLPPTPGPTAPPCPLPSPFPHRTPLPSGCRPPAELLRHPQESHTHKDILRMLIWAGRDGGRGQGSDIVRVVQLSRPSTRPYRAVGAGGAGSGALCLGVLLWRFVV